MDAAVEITVYNTEVTIEKVIEQEETAAFNIIDRGEYH